MILGIVGSCGLPLRASVSGGGAFTLGRLGLLVDVRSGHFLIVVANVSAVAIGLINLILMAMANSRRG